MDKLLDSPEDMQWLKDTCLKGVQLPTEWLDFKAAIVAGNDDSPESLKLFMSPVPIMVSDYLFVKFINDGLTYCEYQHYSGITDTPLEK